MFIVISVILSGSFLYWIFFKKIENKHMVNKINNTESNVIDDTYNPEDEIGNMVDEYGSMPEFDDDYEK